MPRRAPTVCATPGCPNVNPCPAHLANRWANGTPGRAKPPGSSAPSRAGPRPGRPDLPTPAAGLATLADKGYTGAGIGIRYPYKGANLAPDNQARNLLITALRAPAERGNALLKSTWKALRRITLCPWRIGQIVTAALVLLTVQRGRW